MRTDTPPNAPTTGFAKASDPLEAELWPEEVEALKNLKAACPESTNYNDRVLMGFLFSRKLDIERTSAIIRKNWEWRKANNFIAIPKYEDLSNNPRIWSGGSTVPGLRTKDGRFPIFLVARVHVPSEIPLPEMKAVMSWLYLEAIYAERMDAFRKGFVIIQDLSGYGWGNFDMKYQKEMSEMMTNSFPLTWKRLIFLNPPSIFKAIKALMRPVMKKKFMDRMEDMTLSAIKEMFDDPSKLPTWFGGNYKPTAVVSPYMDFHASVRGTPVTPKNDAILFKEFGEVKVDTAASILCPLCSKTITIDVIESHMPTCEIENPVKYDEMD